MASEGPGVGVNECHAIPFLVAAGYSHEQIARFYGVQTQTIPPHVNGECGHPEVESPVDPSPPVGEVLRQKRRERGWTQAELGDRVGVSTSTISQWESGKKVPRTRHAWALERAFYG